MSEDEPQPRKHVTGIDTRRWSAGAQRMLWFGIGLSVGLGGVCATGLAPILLPLSRDPFWPLVAFMTVTGTLLTSQAVVVSHSRTRGSHVRWGAYLCGWLALWIPMLWIVLAAAGVAL